MPGPRAPGPGNVACQPFHLRQALLAHLSSINFIHFVYVYGLWLGSLGSCRSLFGGLLGLVALSGLVA